MHMNIDFISSEHIMILTAIMMGTFARIITIKEDYRQYPSIPNGYFIHTLTGVVAASLGAVAIPAFVTNNFVAVTFLALAIQQFREIRKIEKENLKDLEETGYTYRGAAYIDGIAKTFEARNYIALVVSFLTALSIQVVSIQVTWMRITLGVIVGIIVLFILKRVLKGKRVGDIADVKPGKIEVRGSELFVDGIFVSNHLGLDNAREAFSSEAIAAVISPREDHDRIILDNFGQRQAILFDATRSVGVKRYHFIRKDDESGRIVIVLVSVIKDVNKLIKTIEYTPLLESVCYTRMG